MALVNVGARSFLNSFLGGASPNSPNFGPLLNGPTHLAVALDTATPTQAGANFNEPPGADGYARPALSLGSGGDWTIATDADPSLIENSAAISFATATNNNWGNITHLGFFNGGVIGAGTLLWLLALDTVRTINVGQTLIFEAGEIELTST